MRNTKTKLIGLTGPIASGKNEAAKILRKQGAYIIDADKIGHKLLKKNPIKNKILKAFGTVNRQKLGEIVFSDPKKLKQLNMILHPAIKKSISSLIPALPAGRSHLPSQLIVINAAVLKEIGLIPMVDEVWAVLSDRKKRLNRLLKKGLNKKQAVARIKSQSPDREYRKISDQVFINNSSLVNLKKQIIPGLKIC